jgi:hypothetical protein
LDSCRAITWISRYFGRRSSANEQGADGIAVERDEVLSLLKSSQISATELQNFFFYLLRAEKNAVRFGVDPQVFSALLAQSANQMRPTVNKLELWDMLCFFRLSPLQVRPQSLSSTRQLVFFSLVPTASIKQDAKKRTLPVGELMCAASLLAQDPLRPECKARAAFAAFDRDLDRYAHPLFIAPTVLRRFLSFIFSICFNVYSVYFTRCLRRQEADI